MEPAVLDGFNSEIIFIATLKRPNAAIFLRGYL
jgi:hypothetical protein